MLGRRWSAGRRQACGYFGIEGGVWSWCVSLLIGCRYRTQSQPYKLPGRSRSGVSPNPSDPQRLHSRCSPFCDRRIRFIGFQGVVAGVFGLGVVPGGTSARGRRACTARSPRVGWGSGSPMGVQRARNPTGRHEPHRTPSGLVRPPSTAWPAPGPPIPDPAPRPDPRRQDRAVGLRTRKRRLHD